MYFSADLFGGELVHGTCQGEKFAMVGSRWRIEAGADRSVKKVSLWLDIGGGGILSENIRLILILNFGAVNI